MAKNYYIIKVIGWPVETSTPGVIKEWKTLEGAKRYKAILERKWENAIQTIPAYKDSSMPEIEIISKAR